MLVGTLRLAATVQLCKLGLKRRHKSREIDRHDIKASDASVGGHLQKPKKPGRRSTTPAGGAVELHQVGVRNPMADDREKGFSDVNLGV